MTSDPPQIGALAAAFYGAFDNREGRAPGTNDLHAMFMADARITRVTAASVESLTVEAFIGPRAVMLTDGTLVDFHEWEIEAETTVLGAIASRRSRYGKSGTLDGAPYAGGGRKFIQLCRTEGGWRIVSILWEDD